MEVGIVRLCCNGNSEGAVYSLHLVILLCRLLKLRQILHKLLNNLHKNEKCNISLAPCFQELESMVYHLCERAKSSNGCFHKKIMLNPDLTTLDSHISLSSKYLQGVDHPGILSLNVTILEHWPTNHTPIIISLDQPTLCPACQNDTVQVMCIHLRLHQLTQ